MWGWTIVSDDLLCHPTQRHWQQPQRREDRRCWRRGCREPGWRIGLCRGCYEELRSWT
jgi:hypothetical protein